MPAESAIRVKGYRELQRALSRSDKTLKKNLNKALREASEPVRAQAQLNAKSEIRNMTELWSRMRVGVTQKVVYVAPRQRGVRSRALDKRRRPNLALLLMNRAMQPALDANKDKVYAAVDKVLDDVERTFYG